jgi:hypothetical protein
VIEATTAALLSLERVAFGALGALLAYSLCRLGASSGPTIESRWSRAGSFAVLALLGLDVQAVVLIRLLGADGTQDGLLAGDVRLRNAAGVVASIVVWIVFVARAARHVSPDRIASGNRGV